MWSPRTFLTLLVGFTLFIHPIGDNGPSSDTQFTYEVTPVNISDDESVETMYHLPAVVCGTDSRVRVTREAVNTTVSWSEGTISPALRIMMDVQFLADDAEDQYYCVDARITNGEFRLDATPVSARTVAEELAVASDNVPTTKQKVLNVEMTRFHQIFSTLVAKDDRFLLVQPAKAERVADLLAVPKLIGYALGTALMVWAVGTKTHLGL